MKTKLLLLIVTLFSFAASCEPEPITETEPIGCDCRKMYYTNQLVTGGFQFVYTHRGEWEIVDCSIKESGTLQPNGFIWSNLINYQDDDHAYRWECKNE
jgi:hypothetical protein